jgi:hypothetical protein
LGGIQRRNAGVYQILSLRCGSKYNRRKYLGTFSRGRPSFI